MSCPESYVILHNVSKKHNVGTISRCATAFNVTQICLVGSNRFNAFGSHGSDAHVDFGWHASIEACCQELREEKGAQIVGVEIMPSALPVHSFPFRGPTAFMLGNEGQGLSERQIRNCDAFIYIPQYGAGTASLNVAVAASIVLHHFALWAGFPERGREGQKFIVAPRPQSARGKGLVKPPPGRSNEGASHGDHGPELTFDFSDAQADLGAQAESQLTLVDG
ncbi:CGLD33 [Auxenochlorella protothecoides x Auxenochlorella symbiontica]